MTSDMLQNRVSHRFRLQWLQLARTKNVGPRAFTRLIDMFKDPGNALAELPKFTKYTERIGKIEVASEASVEQEMERTKKFGARFVLSCDEEYPKLLRKIQDYPPVLVVKGRVELLNQPSVAIVGARNASANGCVLASHLAKELARSSYVINSGMARGIDAAAHVGGLQYGTIGTIASGIDIHYPKENEKLYNKLYDEGLIITEYPIGTSPIAQYFPQRNRIISGLSLGVVIVEAAKKSGTLITAKLALDQGRDVFAVPGSPLDPRCSGTNNLLKQGAILVENAEDIIEELSTVTSQYYGQDGALFDKNSDFVHAAKKCTVSHDVCGGYSDDSLNKFRACILSKLSYAPVRLDLLLNEIEVIPDDIVNLLLLELELSGKIEYCLGNSICLVAE